MQAYGGLARRVSRWTIIVFLILGLMVFAAEWMFKQQVAGITDEINYHMDQQNKIQMIDKEYRSAVSNFRAYLAYGRSNFLTLAEADRDQFLQELDLYRSQLSSSDSMQSTVNQLSRQSQEYFSYYPIIENYKQQNQQAEIELLSESVTTSLIRSVNADLDELAANERAEINRLMAESHRMNSIVLFVPLIFIVLSLVAAILLVQYLRRSMIRPVVEMESAVRQISNGEYIQLDTGSSKDEISSLMEGINDMSKQLEERHQQLQNSLVQMEEQHEELEAQNEEILAQQHAQSVILDKLTERESQLQLINSYQEKLTGFSQIDEFLENSLRALVNATHHDAVMLVMQTDPEQPESFQMIYSIGWPKQGANITTEQLYGPALQVIEERKPLVRSRSVSTEERGMHQGYERADDHYYPIFDEELRAIGYILFTTYGSLAVHIKDRMMTEGLIKQFGLAYQAQLASEQRRRQSIRLKELNAELETEKLLIKQQRDSIQEIIDSLQEGLLLCDHQGIISFANEQISRVLPDMRTGAPITSLKEFLDRQAVSSPMLSEQIQQTIRDSMNNWKTQFTLRARDGSIHHMELYINVITGADLQEYHLLVFRDRTEEEQANQLKNEFVSIVSHELRTPLASILGFIEILLHRDVKPEKSKKYMETIHREANRLSNLISDFLDLQRMESGKQSYTMVPLDLRTVVSDVAGQWDGKQEHRVHLHMPQSPALVSADADRLTQVMHNLISNAIKYSPGKDQIDVTVREIPGYWLAEVQDYGLGIPEESKAQMFGKFYRVDNSDRRQIGGTGLGLAIVREIVRDLGGEVYFESELGHGSTFIVKLPIIHTPKLDHKIIVIEDEENLARLIGATFEEQHYEILSLDNAEEALLGLEQLTQPPLLCIVDIYLKGKQTGWDFITALKANPLTRQVPVIISSALDQPEDFVEKQDEKYLQKPFTVERMKELGISLIQDKHPAAHMLIAGQNEQKIQNELKKNGLQATQLEVIGDVIAVNLLNDSEDNISS